MRIPQQLSGGGSVCSSPCTAAALAATQFGAGEPAPWLTRRGGVTCGPVAGTTQLRDTCSTRGTVSTKCVCGSMGAGRAHGVTAKKLEESPFRLKVCRLHLRAIHERVQHGPLLHIVSVESMGPFRNECPPAHLLALRSRSRRDPNAAKPQGSSPRYRGYGRGAGSQLLAAPPHVPNES